VNHKDRVRQGADIDAGSGEGRLPPALQGEALPAQRDEFTSADQDPVRNRALQDLPVLTAKDHTHSRSLEGRST